MKTKYLRLLNKFVFLYGAIFALALTIAGLTSGLNKANFITTLLFLPVSLFFIYQATKKVSRRFNSNSTNIKSFFAQNDVILFITLGLFIFIVAFSLFRSINQQLP